MTSPLPAASGCLPLEGELTIREAALVHERLSAALDAGTTVLDLSAVTELDSAGVQLLAAWARSLADRGARLQLRAPSEAVVSVCRTYGLDDWLATAAA